MVAWLHLFGLELQGNAGLYAELELEDEAHDRALDFELGLARRHTLMTLHSAYDKWAALCNPSDIDTMSDLGFTFDQLLEQYVDWIWASEHPVYAEAIAEGRVRLLRLTLRRMTAEGQLQVSVTDGVAHYFLCGPVRWSRSITRDGEDFFLDGKPIPLSPQSGRLFAAFFDEPRKAKDVMKELWPDYEVDDVKVQKVYTEAIKKLRSDLNDEGGSGLGKRVVDRKGGWLRYRPDPGT